MTRFRKKPVVIDAVKITPGSVAEERPSWLIDAINRGTVFWSGNGYTIKTLEGDMRGGVGDWIIRGVKGELYPCKTDIFAATYEAVDA